jgi:hypothetical protein
MVIGKPEAMLVQRHKPHSAIKTLNWIETLNYVKNRTKQPSLPMSGGSSFASRVR